MKENLLLHICCAPDGLYVAQLLQDDFSVSGFFYNPNIYPGEEYNLRLKETIKAAKILNIPLLVGIYEFKTWFQMTKKFKNEPEKGIRCDICYAMRLDKTAQTAKEKGFTIFSTVMSISPWKKADTINRIGRLLAGKYGINFLEANFKKKNGFKKSIELSKKHNFYRQNYCGCLYSLQQSEKINRVKK